MGKTRKWNNYLCEMMVGNVLTNEGNLIKSTEEKDLRFDGSLVDRVYPKI